jgi:acetyl-CoA carboxylase carboxyl transferase subunit alpha
MAAAFVLPFEKPIVELVGRVRELRELSRSNRALEPELRRLEDKAARVARELFAGLTPWQKVQLSRHPNRPYTLDYVSRLFEDFVELHGDRAFADDASIVAGLARFHGRSVAVLGHQKGRGAKDNVKRNFGMPHPEGYRKALRLMQLAARFGAPVITLIDTPGAYPGLGAEERGQSEALARNILEMAALPTPIITAVIGEGGSGGALALGVADRVLMFDNSVYSVISPEGCAAILWKDSSLRERAADALKLTADDLLRLKVIDEIIPEPIGGAHTDPDQTGERLRAALIRHLTELRKVRPEKLVKRRAEKYAAMGAYVEA